MTIEQAETKLRSILPPEYAFGIFRNVMNFSSGRREETYQVLLLRQSSEGILKLGSDLSAVVDAALSELGLLPDVSGASEVETIAANLCGREG